VADLVDTFIARLQVQGEDAAGKLQSAINRLSAEMEKQTGVAQQNAAANKEAAASNVAAAATDDRVTKAKRTTTNELERWIARMDKASKLQLQYRNDVERLTRMEEEQTGTATERAFALELVNKKLQDGLALLNKSTTATVENTRALVDNLAVQERINRVTGVTRGPAGPTPPPAKTPTDLRAEDIQAYGQSLDALRAKYNPLFAAEQAHKEELAEINRVLRLGAIDVNEHAEAVDKETRAYQKQITAINASKAALDAQRAAERAAPTAIQQRINATTGVSGGSDAATRTADIEAYGNELDQLQAKYDPLFAAQKRFEAAQEEINRALKVGAIGVDIHRTALNKAEDAYTTEIVKIRGAATATDTHNKALTDAEKKTAAATKGTGQFNAAVTNLGFQVNDVATGLLSGQSPFTILAQQGGQIAQAFSQGGGAGAVLKGFGESITKLITPTTLAAGAVVGLVGSVILLALRQADVEARIRQYNVSLDIMGTKSEQTAEGLEAVTRSLRDQGVEAAKAAQAINALAQTPGISPAGIGGSTGLAQLALNISGSRGTDLVAQATALGKAVSGTATDLERFNEELGVKYTDAENKAISASKLARDEQKQHGIEYQALQRTYAEANAKNKSDFQKTIDDLKKTWNEFLDEMGPPALAIIRDFFKEFNQFIKNTKHEIELLGQAYDWIKSKLPQASDPQGTGWQDAAKAQAAGARGGTDLSMPHGSLTGLKPEFAEQLQKMIADAASQGINLGISSGFRTYEQQLALYNADIAKHGGMASGMVAAPGTSIHEKGMAADLTRDPAALAWAAANAAKYGAYFPMNDPNKHPFEPWHIEMMGSRGAGSGAPSASIGLPAVPTTAADPRADQAAKGKIILDDQAARNAILADSFGKVGREAVAADARAAALTATLTMQATQAQKDAYVQNEVALALQKHDKANAVLNETERIRVAGVQATTAAYLGEGGEVAGLKAAAEAAAVLEQRAGRTTTAQMLLTASAVEAAEAGAKNVPVLGLQIAASQRLVTATEKGTAAEHEQVLANQVVTATHDALAKAVASGNPALIAQAEAITKSTSELIKRNDVLQQTYQLEQQNNQRTNQIEVLKLQAGLQFQTSEEMQRQVSLLQAKQDLEARGLTTADAIYQKTLANVDALGQQNIALAESQRAAGAINDAIKGVATTIDTTLTDSLAGAFSGQKVKDWGSTVKSTINDITKQLISGLFIKPIIGTALSAAGFGKVGADFGSIGGTFSALSSVVGGGGGGLFGGGGSSTPTEFVQKNAKGEVVGTLTSAASTVKSGGGLLGELGLGGSGSEGIFGTGGSLSGVGDFFSGGLGGIFAHAPTGADIAAGVGPVTSAPGSIFGSTTLGGFAGGVGLGFGAGSIANMLAGGNKTTGTIGSGVGALAGTAIGSLVGMPFLGGLIGGAGGGLLGGMFGGNKKPDAASGGVLNLGTGQITNVQSGGNAENDATASRIGTVLSAALTRALAIPGAKLPGGAVAIQAGSRDGIKLSFAGQEHRFQSAEEAIAAGLNALRDNLTGVSDTVQKVIHSIGDPAQIEGALAFADAYDKLAASVDNAFKDVETAAKTGPFELVKQQIDAVFAGMAQQAEQFGLAVEPVNKALEEATKRLNNDFSKAVDTAFNAATGRDFLTNVQGVIDGYEQMARDASAIGADRSIHDKLGATFNAELNTIFESLSGPQLDEVISKFGDLTNGLPDLARAAKAAAEAATALTRELDRQAAAYQIQQDFDTAAGQQFLAQLRDLDKARKAAQANAASLDLGDTRSGVIQETEHKAALTILQGLTNDQLELARKTLAELNPAFATWVDEAYGLIQASKDAADATQKQADADQRHNAILQAGLQIRQYLNAQETGQDFTSPTSRLQAARSQFQTQLGLARGGDVNALQGITGIADALKSALQGYFASAAPGAQEWEDVKAALASLPGVPDAQQTQTNAIVDAITEASTATVTGVAEATAASAQSIIGTTIATNQAIVDNARATARDIVAETGASSTRIVSVAIDTSNDIVRNAIDGSARITGATTSGAELVSGATLLVANAANSTAEAVTYGTDVSKGGTLALLASNEANSRTLIAGSKEDTENLLAQQEGNANALLAANAQQSAALVDQNIRNAAAVVSTTNATAQSIVAGNNTSAASIIDTATRNSEAVRTTANDNTAALAWTAHATSSELGARTEAASAGVAATTQAGTNAVLAKTNEQIAAIQALAGVSVGDVQVITALYNVGGWIVGDNAAWSNAIYQQIAAYGAWNTMTVDAWGNATVGTVAAWGNANIGTLNYWGQADVNYQAWAANSIVSMLAQVSNSITNSIFAADNITVGAIYGSSSNEIGATFANGNAIIGAIGSMSVGNIAATYGAANSIVAQVAAGAPDPWATRNAVYDMSRDVTWWLSNVYNRVGNVNDNEVAWSQNLWNKLNDMHYTLNVYLSKIADNTWVIREYINLLTEVTIQFDIWMAAKTDAQHDALVDIETNLRRNAFG
jgi:hypothetical protein